MLETRSFNRWVTLVPSDTVDLDAFLAKDALTIAVYVGTGGDVAFVDEAGTPTVWPNVQSGTLVPVCVRRVNSTGTVASGLIACYAV